MSKDTESDLPVINSDWWPRSPRPGPVSLRSDRLSVPVQLLRSDITNQLSMNEFIFLLHLLAFLDDDTFFIPASPGRLSECLKLTTEFIRGALSQLENRAFIARVTRQGIPDAFDLSPLLYRLKNTEAWNTPSLHICPRCGKSVKSSVEAEQLFGFRRTQSGKRIIQSWCKSCRLRKASSMK